MTRIITYLTYVLSAFMLMMIGFSSALAQNGTANVQIIHNSPDPAVSSVDIYVNGDEFLTDVDFRAATAFTEVPAGVELNMKLRRQEPGSAQPSAPLPIHLKRMKTM